jgi:hypothetical protein
MEELHWEVEYTESESKKMVALQCYYLDVFIFFFHERVFVTCVTLNRNRNTVSYIKPR